MEKIWNNAKFIYTEFENYFDPENAWGRNVPRLFQHNEIVDNDGLPMFVSDFEISNGGKTELIFSALGIVDIYINGKRVGNDEMKPGWTEYHKRALYYNYDISDYVYEGKNRILAVVSTGWYSGRIVGSYYGGNMPAFIANIVHDGNSVLVTDESWSATVGGPVRTADIWDGEYCDATQDSYEQMSKVGYDVEKWDKAAICDYFKGVLTPFVGPTVQVRDELSLKAKKMTVYDGIKYNGSNYGEINVCAEPKAFPLTLKKGQTLIIDLEQEMVGWAKLTLKGERGTTVNVHYAEFLNDSGEISRGNDGAKGSLYTINLRSALAKGTYILSGREEETYRPTFTFYGYRYVQISADQDIEILDFISEVVDSVTEEIGTIETSNELVNKLISNTLWGQRGNYLSVPTDCPQRDERFGWTGDAQAFSVTAAYNADVRDFFRKWMQDARDAQSDEGAYTEVIPKSGCCTAENEAGWTDVGIIVPYNMYVMYNDVELLREHYNSMEKYIAQLIKKFGMAGANARFGDWLAYDQCDKTYVSSVYFVHDIDLMIKMSEVLGKSDRAEHYKELRKQAYAYFVENYMKDGKLIGQTQTDKILALAFDLVDADYAKILADELVEQIKANGNRLSTGFLGTYTLCTTLSKYGKDKMAYTLLMQRNEPSWLYSIDQGATTIWERWNSYTKEKGFGDVGMNSFNHYAYGSVVEWMYRYMAGIEPGVAGFGTVILQPRLDTRNAEELPDGQQRMTYVKASYKSAAGLIESEWHNEDSFTYKCTVPVTAELRLPIMGEKLLINGVEHSFDEYERKDGCAVINLASGEYVFEEK
ncbi:MAG TPA: hypothetical protein DCY15_04045 [Ruminococcaceae bacterium]|nr:hypothetical protein [Oscillospiraceae bacterium]